MPISTESSTFEFAREWLLSSDTFLVDAMGATAGDLDGRRDETRPRIHSEEAYDEPDDAQENETAPDLPPSPNARPRAIVTTQSNTRRRNGIGTWRGEGELLISLEVLVPEEMVALPGTDTIQEIAAKFVAVREWARQLSETIADELRATSGIGSADGKPYLNASDVDFETMPNFPEDAEDDLFGWMGWTYRVAWN